MNKGTILIVESDLNKMRSAVKAVRSRGYGVLPVFDLIQARELTQYYSPGRDLVHALVNPTIATSGINGAVSINQSKLEYEFGRDIQSRNLETVTLPTGRFKDEVNQLVNSQHFNAIRRSGADILYTGVLDIAPQDEDPEKVSELERVALKPEIVDGLLDHSNVQYRQILGESLGKSLRSNLAKGIRKNPPMGYFLMDDLEEKQIPFVVVTDLHPVVIGALLVSRDLVTLEQITKLMDVDSIIQGATQGKVGTDSVTLHPNVVVSAYLDQPAWEKGIDLLEENYLK